MKKTVSIILSLVLCLALSLTAFAADGAICTVSYTNASQFIFNPEGGDLFKSFKDVMPGDELTQEIVIANQLSEKDVTLYLRAEIDDEYKEFLKNIEIKVTLVNPDRQTPKVIAENLAYTPGVLVENTSLGTYAPGETGKLTVTIKVDKRMGNEFANAVGVVNWIFTAEEGETTTIPDEPTTKPTTPDKPTTPNPDEPTTKKPDTIKPGQPDIPDTGADFNPAPVIVLIVALGVVIILFLNKKKKDDKDNEDNFDTNDINITPPDYDNYNDSDTLN